MATGSNKDPYGLSGTPAKKQPALGQILVKSFGCSGGIIATAGVVNGLTGKTGFSALRITVIALAVIGAAILGGVLAYYYFRDKVVRSSALVAVGLVALVLVTGVVIGHWGPTVWQRPVGLNRPCACGPVIQQPASSSAAPSRSPATRPPSTTAGPAPSVSSAPPAGPTTSPPSGPAVNPAVARHEPTAPYAPLKNPDNSGVPSAVFSPDGKTVVTADLNGGHYLFAAATGTYITAAHSQNNQAIWSVAVSQNGKLLAAGTGDGKSYDNGSVYLWSMSADPRLIMSKADPEQGSVGTVVISPDSKVLAWADNKGAVYLLTVATGALRTLQPFSRDSGYSMEGLAFSPDGSRLAGAGMDGGGYLWSVAAGQPIGQPLYGPNSKSGNGVAFSPDGSRLAIADASGSVDLWDLASRSVQAYTGPSGAPMQGVGFTPDGRMLIATASDDKNPHAAAICVWNVATRALIGAPLHDPATDGLFRLAVSPDSKTLAVSDGNANAYLWDLTWFGSQVRA
jgi:sugar lactone lactonase YvrE